MQVDGRRQIYRSVLWGFLDPKDAHWDPREEKEGIVCDLLELWAYYLQSGLVQTWSKKTIKFMMS